MNLIVETSNGLFDLGKYDRVYLEEDEKSSFWYMMAQINKEPPVEIQEYERENGARWGLGEVFMALRMGSRGTKIIPRYKANEAAPSRED